MRLDERAVRSSVALTDVPAPSWQMWEWWRALAFSLLTMCGCYKGYGYLASRKLSQLCSLKDICTLGLPLLIVPLLEVRGNFVAACCDFGRDLNCSSGDQVIWTWTLLHTPPRATLQRADTIQGCPQISSRGTSRDSGNQVMWEVDTECVPLTHPFF